MLANKGMNIHILNGRERVSFRILESEMMLKHVRVDTKVDVTSISVVQLLVNESVLVSVSLQHTVLLL